MGDGEYCDIVTFYSECDYDGEVYTVKDEDDCLPFTPKSVCLPPYTSITLWGLCYFEGESVEIANSVDCLETYTAEFIRISQKNISKKNGNNNSQVTFKINHQYFN